MASKLIRLNDGTMVEVEVPEDEVKAIAFRFADTANKSIDAVRPLLTRLCRELHMIRQELEPAVALESAQVEVGLAFEGEGNVYITKTKAGANLVVRLSVGAQSSGAGA